MCEGDPLVSVIVPVHNSERFLDRCIDSILTNTYRRVELILIDDDSSDSSFDICDKWSKKDSRILLHRICAKSVSIARNTGISLSTGDYLMFVDSDDTISLDAIEWSVNQALSHQCDMVIFDKDYIDENDQVVQEARGQINDYIVGDSSQADVFYLKIVRLLKNGYLNPPWGKLFSRKIINGLFFQENMIYEEDLVFVLAVLRRSPNFLVSKNPFYHYRHMASGLASVFSKKKVVNVIYANREKIDFFSPACMNQTVMTQLAFCIINDINWIIDQIICSSSIEVNEKISLIRKMTDDSVIHPYVMKGLSHAWMSRIRKAIILLDSSLLWKLYISILSLI